MEQKNVFSPAATRRASEVIYDQIYEKIISGQLRPGDRLPSERELAEQFHRSRPSIREALRALEQDGFVTIAVGSGGGCVIRGVSMQSVAEPMRRLVGAGAVSLRELADYRIINDQGCARLAAQYHTAEDDRRLTEIMEDYRASVRDPARLRTVDMDFHKALAQASHNALAILINDVIATLNTNMFWDSVRDMSAEQLLEINRRACGFHQSIVDGILAGDPVGAAQGVARIAELFRSAVQ